jgi:Protein of unknown function (DUF3558)
MGPKLRLAALTAAALMVTAACSSGSTPSSGSSSSSAPVAPNGMGFTADALCALVTTDEMSAALGQTVGPGVPSGVNAPACTWQAADASGATIAATDAGSVGQLPFGLQGVTGAQLTAVSGLGDKAFFASGSMGQSAELDIAKGGKAITITVALADPNTTLAQQEAAEQAIGTAAVKNM